MERHAEQRTRTHGNAAFGITLAVSLAAQRLMSNITPSDPNPYSFQFWFTLITVFLPFYLFAQALGLRVNQNRASGATFIPGLAFGFGMVPVIAALMSLITPHFQYSNYIQQNGTQYIGSMIFVYAIATPIMEEIVYRGIILTYLRRFGDRFALIAQAVLFSLCHRNPVQSISTFFFALVLGYIVLTTGNIWAGVLAHFFNNLFALYGTVPIPWAVALVGMAGLYFLSKYRTFTRYRTADPSILGALGVLAVCADDIAGEIKSCIIR